jgi:hypothetical protein
MTWLWLSSVALLLGAEINAEAERSRELRSGLPAQDDLVVPTAEGKPPETAPPPPPAAPAHERGALRAPAVAITGVLALALWMLRGSRATR